MSNHQRPLTCCQQVALAFPFNVYPCRFTIEMSLFADSRPSKSRFNIITAAIVFSALAIAIFVPSLDRVFSLLGSVCLYCYCLQQNWLIVVFLSDHVSIRLLRAASAVLQKVSNRALYNS